MLHFQPVSQPLLPAHALVADSSRQQLLLLVRGTSGWHDCLTDLVAHTAPLGQGGLMSGFCAQCCISFRILCSSVCVACVQSNHKGLWQKVVTKHCLKGCDHEHMQRQHR